MRAAVYYDKNDFRVEDIPQPEIQPYEALVKVVVCGVCGTDVHKAVHKTVNPPIVLGHEVAGDVVEVGEKVKKFKVGDRVVVPHHTPCFACSYCHHGHYTLCDQYTKTNIYPGGFSEYIRVPQPNVERAMLDIGDLDYEEAAFVEPVACCLHGWEKLRVLPGDTVLVVGSGPIGLIHLELAKAFNAQEVLVADIVEKRLEYAQKFGGIPVHADETCQADIVIVAAGNIKAYEFALKSVKKGGQISFFAECPPGSALSLEPNFVYAQELTFSGSYSSTPFGHWKALNLIRKYINVKNLITHRFRLEDTGKAIEMASKAEDCLKIMIRP